MENNIAIIGGGNLGTAIAEGLIASGFVQASQITITKRNLSTIQHLADKGVRISTDNTNAIKNAQYILLAVKPFQIKEILESLKPNLSEAQHTIISVATGVWIKDLETIVTNQFPIIRAMPNTAIAIQESMTCICSNQLGQGKIAFVTDLFNQLGKSIVIDEKLMDAATVLAASGTAFALRYIRASMQAGIEIGFDWQTALAISAQTVKGAAEMLLEEKTHPEQLIDRVTTPQGCTIAGLNEMELHGFSSSLIKGIKTSLKQIKG